MPNTRKAKYVQDIEKAIELIRHRVRENREYFESREERTRHGLIDPMLRALGWDLSDPAQVKVEYDPFADKRDGKRLYPDYAFFRDGPNGNEMPVMIVEAKVITRGDIRSFLKELEGTLSDFDAKDYEQLENYTPRRMKEGYQVLTNGSYWDIYSLTPPRAPLKRRKEGRPTYFSILDDYLPECVEQLEALHRSNLQQRQ